MLNPATPLQSLQEILGEADFILLMTVNPGWGGQSFIPSGLDKIRTLKAWIRREKLEVPVQVDGGIKLDNLEEIFRAGMDIADRKSVV